MSHQLDIPRQSIKMLKKPALLWSIVFRSISQEIIICIVLLTSDNKSLSQRRECHGLDNHCLYYSGGSSVLSLRIPSCSLSSSSTLSLFVVSHPVFSLLRTAVLSAPVMIRVGVRLQKPVILINACSFFLAYLLHTLFFYYFAVIR